MRQQIFKWLGLGFGDELAGDKPDRFGHHGQRTAVVAEISNAHNGSLERARQLIVAAANAGAHAVKFQAYTPDDLVNLRGDGPAPDPWGSEGWSMRDLYLKARTPLEWFPDLVATARHMNIPWFASVFGPDGLAAMEDLQCPVYKLASIDNGKRAWRRTVHATGKPIIRSVPGDYRPHNSKDEAVLWCPPGYPQPHLNFKTMRAGRFDGFSYHGTSPIPPAVAAAFGAKIVEVHIHFAAEPSDLEATVSLTIERLAELVQAT